MFYEIHSLAIYYILFCLQFEEESFAEDGKWTQDKSNILIFIVIQYVSKRYRSIFEHNFNFWLKFLYKIIEFYNISS